MYARKMGLQCLIPGPMRRTSCRMVLFVSVFCFFSLGSLVPGGILWGYNAATLRYKRLFTEGVPENLETAFNVACGTLAIQFTEDSYSDKGRRQESTKCEATVSDVVSTTHDAAGFLACFSRVGVTVGVLTARLTAVVCGIARLPCVYRLFEARRRLVVLVLTSGGTTSHRAATVPRRSSRLAGPAARRTRTSHGSHSPRTYIGRTRM